MTGIEVLAHTRPISPTVLPTGPKRLWAALPDGQRKATYARARLPGLPGDDKGPRGAVIETIMVKGKRNDRYVVAVWQRLSNKGKWEVATAWRWQRPDDGNANLARVNVTEAKQWIGGNE